MWLTSDKLESVSYEKKNKKLYLINIYYIVIMNVRIIFKIYDKVLCQQ